MSKEDSTHFIHRGSHKSSPRPAISRKRIFLKHPKSLYLHHQSNSQQTLQALETQRQEPHPLREEEQAYVLVINASSQMAGHISERLRTTLPNHQILYSPSLKLADWMLKRKKIDLIISSEVLPDGGIDSLQEIIRRYTHKPDLVVVGKGLPRSIYSLKKAGYDLVSCKRVVAENPIKHEILSTPKDSLQEKQSAQERADLSQKTLIGRGALATKITTLGADLRNDLNNPLQEIVTLAFAVKQSSSEDQVTQQAIEAIEEAAKQMAGTVQKIEDRVKSVVMEY